MARTREVTVGLGARGYPVVLAEGGGFAALPAALAARLDVPRLVLVHVPAVSRWAAEVVEALQGHEVEVEAVVLDVEEATKTVGTWAGCVDRLLEAGVDRATPVAALGGGVIGDVVGFAAATVLRGVPLVQLPTTVLAMVDASVGGKTGVNHPLGKNLVGAFHQPVLVFAALSTLSTLPARDRIAGLAEVVKAALLGDADLLARLEDDAAALREGDPAALLPVIARAVEIKAAIVAADEREGGTRALLNLGHTLGHALERAVGFGRLRHGEAVACGLVAETRWAVRRGTCVEPGLPARLKRLFDRLGLPCAAPRVDPRALEAGVRVDKKSFGGKLRLPVATRPGHAVLVDLPTASVTELVREIR